MSVVSMGHRHVDHELCRICDHDETCGHVCAAIEALVQISLETKILTKLEMIDKAADLLDLENSFNGDTSDN